MESSREIEKMFYSDSFGKKKIGSNVHRRTGKGGDRAGVRGGLRFAKNNFKRNEKNSKVTTTNIFDNVITFHIFNKFDEDMRIVLLIEWRRRFTDTHIRKELKVSIEVYDRLIHDLNIEENEKEANTMNREELEQAKQEVIPYHEFVSLPKWQKYELVDYYQKKLKKSAREISEIWNGKLSPNSIGTSKSKWKEAWTKHLEEPEEEIEEEPIDTGIDYGDDFLLDDEPEYGDEQEDIHEDEEVVEHNNDPIEEYQLNESQANKVEANNDNVKEQPNQQPVRPDVRSREDNSFSMQLNNKYDGATLSAKLHAFASLVNGNGKFKINMSINEVSDNDEKELDWELLEKIINNHKGEK
ncbi:hypothetical protein [Aquibacillus saliphilus]|uniref:hypothetical protein n=1 Tax=Aquibacillus saliphilus TaxID=1909422 RepID=UPI001CF047BF|nr:hypothetical protein [Aquibacillus saliphilus]